MTTLRDLTEIMWDITHITVTARDGDLKFLHEWQYGPDIKETIHMYHRRIEGQLTIVDGKINAHGDDTGRGPETGWGVKTKLIPKDLLDAPITHMNVTPSHSRECHISVDVTMHPLTVMGLIGREDE